MADEYGSVSSTIGEDKKKLLEAAATGGSAGVAAYKQGQEALAAGRQASVARAAQLSGLIGGPEAQGFDALSSNRYDQGIANLGSAQATFSADMGRRSGAFNDYLSKAQASVPAYRAQTDRLVGLKAAAAAAAEAKAAKTAAAKDPTADLLLAAGRLANQNPLAKARLDANSNILSSVTDEPDSRMARLMGQDMGFTPLQVETALSPSKLKSYADATMPKPEKDTYAAALAAKYDTKGVTPELAKSVVNNVDFQDAAKTLLSLDPTTTTYEAQEKWLRDNFLTKDGRNWLAEYNILVGEYLGRFPKAG